MIACRHSPGLDASDALLVMLPGAGIGAEEFFRHGMVAMAQAAAPALHVTVAEPDLDLYLDGRIAEALEEFVIAPARAGGRARIWLLGISLGGMGALLHAERFPGALEGLILLAPFLGTRGSIAGLAKKGGFAAAHAPDSPLPEARMQRWLGAHLGSPGTRPRLLLGYGESDRFAAGHRLLARHLPPDCVAAVPGGHDWASWTELWRALLARWTPG